MEPTEKQLAQLEKRHKHVTYRIKMYPISTDGKFFFDRTSKFPISKEKVKNGEFFGEVITDFSIYYPEEHIDEDSVILDCTKKMELAAGKWNYAMISSNKYAWMITRTGAELYPLLERGRDYDFEVIEKIVHDPERNLYEDIKPLKPKKKEAVSK